MTWVEDAAAVDGEDQAEIHFLFHERTLLAVES